MYVVVEKNEGVAALPRFNGGHRAVGKLHSPHGLLAQIEKKGESRADDSSVAYDEDALLIGGERFLKHRQKTAPDLRETLSARGDEVEGVAFPFSESVWIGGFRFKDRQAFPNAEPHLGEPFPRFGDRSADCGKNSGRFKSPGERTREHPRSAPAAETRSKASSLATPLFVQRNVAFSLETILTVPFGFPMTNKINVFFCHVRNPRFLSFAE